MELAVFAETVRMVFGMQPIRSCLVVDSQNVSVYKGYLNGKSRVKAHLILTKLVHDAGVVVHMQADACKFLGQTIEDVEIAPHWLVIDRS